MKDCHPKDYHFKCYIHQEELYIHKIFELVRNIFTIKN